MMLEVAGRVVPIAPGSPRRVFNGRVRVDAGRVVSVRQRRQAPTDGTRYVDVDDAFIYPGIVDLHSHVGFNALPLWREEARATPWLHRGLWPGAPSYKPKVSWPAYAYMKGAPEALMAYGQVRALAGGTTAIQGWPPANRNPANKLVRNIDDDFGAGVVRTSVVNLGPAELADRARLIDGGATLIYHLSEGRRDSIAAREFEDAARARCLRNRLIAIHCTAVDEPEFEQWSRRAALDDDAAPGGVVWSPFSNLWLYGETTQVEAAMAHGVRVCLGSDWGPSGSKNLLGELKVARMWADQQGLPIDDHALVTMVTASPGDLMAQAWGLPLGRLVPGGVGDMVVVARRRDDPWSNLVAAREQDVLLVIVDGAAVYGTRPLMRACGVTATTAVPIGRQTRHVPLRQPEAPTKTWTWRNILAELGEVAADPLAAIDRAHHALAQAFGLDVADAGPRPAPVPLILEPDMPGGAHAIAGPPPAGATFTMTKPPSLVHDGAWWRSVPTNGFDGGLLRSAETFYQEK